MIGIGFGSSTQRYPGISASAFGLKMDGITEGATSLQNAIDQRKSVIFYSGVALISTTITLPQSPPMEGITLIGEGSTSTDPINSPSNRYRSSTVLKWGGGSETLLEILDAVHTQIKDIVFHGDDNADILIHYKTSGSNYSGLSRISNVNFYNAATLVKCGEDAGDGTCADIYFSQVGFKSATYGLEIINSQGVNYNFNQLTANDIESVIRFTEGGHLKMSMANFIGCGNDVNGNYAIHSAGGGENAFSIQVDTIRFEQGCENFFYADGKGASVINCLTEAQASSSTNKITLKGHTLTINDSRIASWDSLADLDFASGVRSYLHFNRVYFSSNKTFEDIEDMLTLNGSAPTYVTFRECTVNVSGSQRPLRDFNLSLVNGPVEHTCQITGNGTSKNATLWAQASQNYYNTLELETGVTVLETRISGVETTSGEIIGATLTGTVYWSGSALTVLEQSVTNKYTDDASVFNDAQYIESAIGARVEITNVTGTWDYVAVTRKIA